MNLNENKRLVSPCGNGPSLGPKWPKIGLRWPKVVTRNACYAVACGYSEEIIFASDKSAKLKIMSTRF